jgi:hypothetical protein
VARSGALDDFNESWQHNSVVIEITVYAIGNELILGLSSRRRIGIIRNPLTGRQRGHIFCSTTYTLRETRICLG